MSVQVEKMSRISRDLNRLFGLNYGTGRRIGQLERRCGQLEQAILELDAALRRAGITPEELALPSPPEKPALQNADPASTLSP